MQCLEEENKLSTTKHDTEHTNIDFLRIILVEILPVVPTAEFRTSLMDNSTTFPPVSGQILAFHWYWHIPDWFVYLPWSILLVTG